MKKENGITLVALIITIIVLLILATVSISLVINGGIIDKTKLAVDKYSEEEIGEQIKLAYLELETEKLYNSHVNDEEFLTDSLKQKINDNNLTVKVKNGKITVKIYSKKYDYDIEKSIVEKHIYIDPFNYGGKAKKDLVPGDDITLGTEKFRVFYNKDGVIKAMPWYNIELKLDNPKQNSSAKSTMFSTEIYWQKKEDSIDMSDSRNNIQQYIKEYKNTLENLGAEEIEIRVARKSELKEIDSLYRNPGQTGQFWTCSAVDAYVNMLYHVDNNGDIAWTNGYYSLNYGVRPIIIIKY